MDMAVQFSNSKRFSRTFLIQLLLFLTITQVTHFAYTSRRKNNAFNSSPRLIMGYSSSFLLGHIFSRRMEPKKKHIMFEMV